MDQTTRKLTAIILISLLLVPFLASCNLPAQLTQGTPTSQDSSLSKLQQTKVTFRVTVPNAIPAGDSLYITLLDEVTGLAFNSRKYIMQAEDNTHYSVTLPLYVGMLIKYRYSREGTANVDEHLYNNRPVRYRIYNVTGPGIIEDMLSGWTDSPYTGVTGRIMGIVTDSSTGKPIPNILVTAGGEQALSLADGSYLLEGLPPGTHNLVFYSLDGAYNVFQQGAVVAANSTTPASISLIPARLVTVIFNIKVPADTPPDAPIRLAGNLAQLGNTFADLAGGMSSSPSRMPQLGKLANGQYMVTLSLPAGAYLEYKYTLGDGLWSSELTPKGGFQLRQLIVPKTDIEVSESIDTWTKKGESPIQFEVKIPANTPQNDAISIQFNPGFGWLEPLPMWAATNATGASVWRFDLTSPFNSLASLHYRYCRQGQCGAADDAATMGVFPEGRTVKPNTNPGNVQDEVLNWAWYSGPSSPPSVPGVQVNVRETGFMAGIALQPAYHPSWQALIPSAVRDIQSLGVNTVILSPTWSFTNNTPPILEQDPAQDMLWPDLVQSIGAFQGGNLSVGIYPQPHFPTSVDQWWQSAARDYPWWMSFYERYTNFVLQNATAAAETNSPILILGGDWLNPALPGGMLPDGTPSGLPQDAEQIWRGIIEKVRERYNGKLGWVLSYPNDLRNSPPFLDAVDQVYLAWSAPLASQPGTSLGEMQAQATSILNGEILPFQEQIGKPILIALSYPSIDRAATGCIAIQGGGCLDYAQLSPPNTDIAALNLDLQAQAEAYNAILGAINDQPWVAGYISMGYYPPAVLQDKSISIHGKPASGVLWYWSTKYLGR